MAICKTCGTKVEGSDLRSELSSRADALGMECLTEGEQHLVLGDICEDCYNDLY